MEKLYNQGFLSYPRTETTKYNKTINLKQIVEGLKNFDGWADHTSRMMEGEMWQGPRNGNKDDQAHPPIHPVKLARPDQLN